MSPRKPRRLRRWLVAIGLGLVLLVGTGVVVLRAKFHGPALAEQIETMLNRRMRGRIDIGTIEWPMHGLTDMVTGGWVPVTIRNVTVWDRRADERTRDCFEERTPPPPRRVLQAPEIEAELDVHALMFGRHDLVFRNVHIKGGHVRLEQIKEPYPLHAYDKTIVSLVAAFYPCMKPGYHAGFYAASPPPIFDLRNIKIDGLAMDVLFGPDDTIAYDDAEGRGPAYKTTLEILDVNAEGGFLYMDPTDPLVSRMYFSIAPKTGPAVLRMWDYGVKPRGAFLPSWMAPEEELHAAKYTIDLKEIQIDRLAQLPTEWPRSGVANTLSIAGHMKTAEDATIRIDGDLIDWWDRQFDGEWHLTVAAQNLGPTLGADILAPLGGDNVQASLELRGPFIALPKLDFTLSGLRYDVIFQDPKLPVMRLELPQLHGWVDFVNENGSLDKTIATATCVRGKPDYCGPVPKGGDIPGQLELSAHFGLPVNLNANLDITQPLDLGPWLPPLARKSFGQHLRGRMRAEGKSDTQLSLDDIDLVLGRTRKDRATRIHGGKIYTANAFDKIELEGLRVDAGGTSVRINGGVTYSKESFGFELTGKSSDLAVWLRRLGAPPIARSAEGIKANISGHRVAGEFKLRSAEASGRLRGVPTVDQVDVVARLEDDLLYLDSVSTPGLGGTLHGGGKVRVRGTPYIESLELEGSNLDLAKVPGTNGAVTGTVRSAKLSAKGSIGGRSDLFDWLGLASGYVVSDNVSVLGDKYNDAALCINYADDELCRRPGAQVETEDLKACDAAKKGGACLVGRASRQDGGALDVTLASPARKGRRTAPLAGTVQVVDVPMEVVTRMLGRTGESPFGGAVSAGLRVGGTRSAPTVEGTVALLRAWVLGAFVGDTELAVAPDPKDPRIVVISGKALHGRVDVVARVGTMAPYPVDVTLTGRRIEIDQIYDLSDKLPIGEPVRAWATGTVSLHAELGGKAEPIAWIELDELGAIVDHRDPDGRAVPLRVNALPGTDGRKAVSIRATPSSVAFKCRGERLETMDCPVKFATPAGVITVSGEATPTRLAIAANGTLDLRLIAPLVDVYFDEVSGSAVVAGNLAGTPDKPEPSASVALKDVRVRPVGQETVVRVPSGLIQVANNSLGFTDVRVRVDDTYLGEKAELSLRGNIALDGFTPKQWNVQITGQLAGKMLLAAAPHVISQASGVAEIDPFITLTGKGKVPNIDATVRFNPQHPLTLTMRGMRREVAFSGGAVAVTDSGGSGNYEIELDDLAGSIDSQGRLRNINGSIHLQNGALAKADVMLDAESIPFKVPRTLDLSFNIERLHIERRSKYANWELSGRRLELVSGSYIRQFQWGEVLRPSAPVGVTTPIWVEYPELGAAELDLTIDIRQFKVQNNVANVEMAGSNLRLTGTPRDPRIDGQIRVQQGTFKIPGTAPRFTRTEGTITFARMQRFPQQTPVIQISSEADYRDSTGQEHQIHLALSGTLSDLSYDLYTQGGFNRSQTLALLLSGRTQEQVNQSLGSDPAGGDPTRSGVSTGSGNPLDQVIRDVAGDTISLLVEDQLKSVSKLDVARPFVSIGAWGFHGEKRLFQNFNVVGDYEQTARGRSIIVRGELKTPFRNFTVQGNVMDRAFNDNSEEDQQDVGAKLVYRLFIP